MPVSQSKPARLTPNLRILWISVCSFWLCGSIVANPIIYRLVPSPSRYKIRQYDPNRSQGICVPEHGKTPHDFHFHFRCLTRLYWSNWARCCSFLCLARWVCRKKITFRLWYFPCQSFCREKIASLFKRRCTCTCRQCRIETKGWSGKPWFTSLPVYNQVSY